MYLYYYYIIYISFNITVSYNSESGNFFFLFFPLNHYVYFQNFQLDNVDFIFYIIMFF